MLNEKLMDVLESIQSNLCLESEKKLAYAYGVNVINYDACERDNSCDDAACIGRNY